MLGQFAISEDSLLENTADDQRKNKKKRTLK